jgi:hypothetical protein
MVQVLITLTVQTAILITMAISTTLIMGLMAVGIKTIETIIKTTTIIRGTLIITSIDKEEGQSSMMIALMIGEIIKTFSKKIPISIKMVLFKLMLRMINQTSHSSSKVLHTIISKTTEDLLEIITTTATLGKPTIIADKTEKEETMMEITNSRIQEDNTETTPIAISNLKGNPLRRNSFKNLPKGET